MSKPKGKHGGKREGAGRPPGSTNALPLGWVGAVKSLKRRLPEDAPEDARTLDNRTFERLVDVMEGRVSYLEAGAILKASQALRDELHGKQAQPLDHRFDSMTDEQLEARKQELLLKWSASGTVPPEGGGT